MTKAGMTVTRGLKFIVARSVFYAVADPTVAAS
jgi:hypothetical protein